MSKRTSNPLADRLAELNITAEELAAVVKRPVEDVQGWIADGPDAEAKVLCRFLADDADAARRVDQLRRTHTRTLEGDGAAYAGINGVPYGTADIGKLDAGAP